MATRTGHQILSHMRWRIDPAFHFHLRCALLIAMSAAFATLFGALMYNASQVARFGDAQRGFDAETQRLSLRIQSQVARLQENDREALSAIEERLVASSARQDASDARVSRATAKAPFSTDEAVAAIVRLVCIDNKDKKTYYTGSGTVIDSTGLVVTNRHVLTSGDGSLIRHCGVGFTADIAITPTISFVGSAVAVQDENDLALLRIVERIDSGAMPTNFPSISLLDSKTSARALEIGDPVFIAGFPGIGADTFTFTQGVVSGRVGKELIKTSALIDSGASGGAAFDAHGSYVGVPAAAVRGAIGGSLGYVIGANVVADFVAAYARGEGVKR